MNSADTVTQNISIMDHDFKGSIFQNYDIIQHLLDKIKFLEFEKNSIITDFTLKLCLLNNEVLKLKAENEELKMTLNEKECLEIKTQSNTNDEYEKNETEKKQITLAEKKMPEKLSNLKINKSSPNKKKKKNKFILNANINEQNLQEIKKNDLIEKESPIINNQSQSHILNITENEKHENNLNKTKSPGCSNNTQPNKKKKKKKNLSIDHMILNKENLEELKPINSPKEKFPQASKEKSNTLRITQNMPIVELNNNNKETLNLNINANISNKASNKSIIYNPIKPVLSSNTSIFKERIIFKDQTFKIVFDLPTPRPHLIILHVDTSLRKTYKSVKDLSESQKIHLIDFVEDFKRQFNIKEFTLSFHLGSWASTNYFHAHICLDIQLYLILFEKLNVDLTGYKPTKNWIIKQSDTMHINDIYIENVKNYEKNQIIKSMNYKQKDMSNIRRDQQKTLNVLDYIETNYELKVPIVKFKLRPNLDINYDKKKYLLLDSMFSFIRMNDLNRSGCHVCLKLIDKSEEAFLRFGADDYFNIHPIPEIFLQQFNQNNNYYSET